MQTSFLHPSVNVRFDLGRAEFIERYLPTPSHTEAIKGILRGFLNRGSHAHIIVGSYGSGKSLLTTILAGIVSKNVDHQSFNTMLERFKTVDEDKTTIEYLEEVYCLPINYIPVVLNGNQGNLRINLMASLYKALDECGLDYSLPSVAMEIEKTIEMWRTDYIGAYDAFLYKLSESNRELKHFLLEIKNHDTKTIEWFKNVYTQLTNGSHLSLSYDQDIVSQLRFVLKELHSKGYGVFFVYDEFGRFMQTLDTKETHEAMHDLQELSELANHNELLNLHVLFISHRNMRQYALKYQNEELEKEFQKIEERFTTYYTLTDQSTFVRLANVITSGYRLGREHEEFVSELRRFNLFEELTLYEVEKLVIRGSYPLHPVTLFVMTHLANQVAQNERTLFTFLESDEVGGLLYQYEKESDWYRVDKLFDYFEPAISDFEKESLVGQYYSLFQRLQRKLIDRNTRSDELKIVKLLTLWNIAALHIKQLPSEEFIAFALSWELEFVSKTLKALQEKKIIRYNHKDEYWDLFEGSIVDITLEISQRINQLLMSNRNRMELLSEVLTNKFILSKEYNDKRSITRFAVIQPILYSELIDEEITVEGMRSAVDSDAVVFLVIGRSKKDENEIKYIRELSSTEERGIIATSKLKDSDVIELINKLAVVKQLQKDQYFLSQDPFLVDELQRTYSDLVYSINKKIEYSFFLNNGIWFYGGNDFTVNKDVELNERLSIIFEEIYNETPEFRNEAYNRRNVSKIQRNSAIQVIDKMLNSQSVNDIQFEGNGPDFFIFRTVIKNTGINCDQPELTSNNQLLIIRGKLLNVLKQRKGKIEELIDIFTNKPHGIRRPLIPLLLLALLKQEWKHIMFYNKGVFNSEVNGELLFFMIENPQEYTFSYHPFEKKYEKLINELEETFIEFVKASERSLHPAVYANRLLLRWLRSLPRITQNTNNLSRGAIVFKTLTRKGEIEPDECLEELYQLFQRDETLFKEIKNECEAFISTHYNLIQSKVLSLTKTNSYVELKKWALNKSPVVRSKNELVKCLIDSDTDTENWIEDICKKMIGVNRENWSDATEQLFMSQIEGFLNKLTDDAYQSYIEVKFGEEALAIPQVQLSDKSKLILNNLKQDVKSMGRTVPKDEIQSLLLLLLRDFMNDM